MTHLWAGVFPTVPVKNNDHAIGGTCAPNCGYNRAFAAYGKLFSTLRGRQWVLAARAAEVTSANALANLFFTTEPAEPASRAGALQYIDMYLAPIVFAPLTSTVAVTLRGLDLPCLSPRIKLLSPTNQVPAVGKLLRTSSGVACDGGWAGVGEAATKCIELEVAFVAGNTAARAGNATMSSVLAVVSC